MNSNWGGSVTGKTISKPYSGGIMISDKDGQSVKGVLSDRLELEKFLDTLHLSGLRAHLTKPSEKSFSFNKDGKISVELHIVESTRFHFMSALKDGGPLDKWGSCFTLD